MLSFHLTGADARELFPLPVRNPVPTEAVLDMGFDPSAWEREGDEPFPPEPALWALRGRDSAVRSVSLGYADGRIVHRFEPGLDPVQRFRARSLARSVAGAVNSRR